VFAITTKKKLFNFITPLCAFYAFQMSLPGKQYSIKNAHVLRRESLARQKQRHHNELSESYNARRVAISKTSPEKIRNFATTNVAENLSKWEMKRRSAVEGIVNKRDPFNTVMHTEVNPMESITRPGPGRYSPIRPGVQVKDPRTQHSAFASKSSQRVEYKRPHANDNIIAAPTITHCGLPTRSTKGALIGREKRDMSMVDRHRLFVHDKLAEKRSKERQERLHKKKTEIPHKPCFIDPTLFGHGREQRYPADIIRGQTTRLGPGYYEPKVHPLNTHVKNPERNSMAFLKTGRRSGPSDWLLNNIPRKDPFFECKKNPFASPDFTDNDYVPDAHFFDGPSNVMVRQLRVYKLC
jgi:hypothetical protein